MPHTPWETDAQPGWVNTPAAATMLVGVAGALAQNDIKRILSFHIVSQIGYMLMGLGLFTQFGLAASILYMVHHIPVKTVLFLVGGLIEDDQGTSDLDRVGGLAARRPWIALLFALPALSLAGIPPLSGFVAKLSLVDAAIDADSIPIVFAALLASVLTLLSMVKIWLGAFWGTDPDDDQARATVESHGRGHRPTMMGVTGFAVAITLFVAASAGTIWELSQRAAADLIQIEPYVSGVLG